jgi:hypothetical protein
MRVVDDVQHLISQARRKSQQTQPVSGGKNKRKQRKKAGVESRVDAHPEQDDTAAACPEQFWALGEECLAAFLTQLLSSLFPTPEQEQLAAREAAAREVAKQQQASDIKRAQAIVEKSEKMLLREVLHKLRR